MSHRVGNLNLDCEGDVDQGCNHEHRFRSGRFKLGVQPRPSGGVHHVFKTEGVSKAANPSGTRAASFALACGATLTVWPCSDTTVFRS